MQAHTRRSRTRTTDPTPDAREVAASADARPLPQKFGSGKDGFDSRAFQLRCNLHDRPAMRLQRHIDLIRAQGGTPSQEQRFDPHRLWRMLLHEGVDFVVIGSWAAILHGARLTTEEIEIL